jgi:hypothetical protein
LDLLLFHLFNKTVGVIALVGQEGLRLDAIHEVMGERDVVALARRGDVAHWKPKRVSRRGMGFCA